MSIKYFVYVIATTMVAGFLAAAPLDAQADRDDKREEATAGSPRGTIPDPPEGFKVLYVFPGARADTIPSISTSVHCTNLDKKDTTFRLECFDFTSALEGSTERLLSIGETRTITCGDSTALYDEDAIITPSSTINQGYVRVLSNPAKKLACNAQVLDASAMPPAFSHALNHFSAKGKR